MGRNALPASAHAMRSRQKRRLYRILANCHRSVSVPIRSWRVSPNASAGLPRCALREAARIVDRSASDIAWPSKDEITSFRENIEHHLSVAGISTDRITVDLVLAARNFIRNRELDDGSETAGHLKRDLLDLAGRTGPKLERWLSERKDFQLALFFGAMPGASIELSIDGKNHVRLLPDDASLVAASVKTLTRVGDDGVAPTGFVRRRRVAGLGERIPHDTPIDEMARFLSGLARIAPASGAMSHRHNHLFAMIAGPLLVAGSLGSETIFRALLEQLSGAAFDERIAVLEEIAPLCLRDIEDVSAGGAHALARYILQEIADQATATERRQALLLFARIFPEALADFARVLAGRIDQHYRLEQSPRLGRLDARRWHEAHAGWKLIDEVLDAISETNGKEPGQRERKAVTSIVWEIIAFANEIRPPEEPPRRGTGPVREDKRGRISAAGDDHTVPNVGNHMVNEDHVKQLIGLRNAIGKIDVVLGILDRKALFDLEPRSVADADARREVGDLRQNIDALQVWRRALEQVREQGDYERGRPTEPRATGARVAVPRMPQVKAEALAAGDETAIAKIVAAAQVLRRSPR